MRLCPCTSTVRGHFRVPWSCGLALPGHGAVPVPVAYGAPAGPALHPGPLPWSCPPAGQGHTLALLASAFPGPLALGLDLRPTALAHALMQALSLALLHA